MVLIQRHIFFIIFRDFGVKKLSSFDFSFQDHRKCNSMTSSNYSGWNGRQKQIMDSQVPMPTWKGFPYHFPISYFHAAEQAQCKFCQDLRWIGVCLCVYMRLRLCLCERASLQRSMHVCLCVSVCCRKYIYQGWAAAFRSTSSFYLLIQYFRF